jgi:hypothetical protein
MGAVLLLLLRACSECSVKIPLAKCPAEVESMKIITGWSSYLQALSLTYQTAAPNLVCNLSAIDLVF